MARPGPRADGEGVAVGCCGHEGQVIELRGGPEPLQMVRCSTCSRREWRLGQQTVSVDAAFEVLAETYRAVPRQARAVRERAATRTAARAAARAATGSARAVPVQACGGRQADGERRVDRADLAGLLQGWSVLGATG